jgi:hypothetical protein
VQSPETNWDDAVAEKVISTVKITDREASVTMPKPVGNPLFEKPDNFPEEVIGIFKENFNNTPVLSVEAIENSIAINATIQKDIKDSEFSDDKKRLLLDSIVKANGFEALEDYIKIPAVTETCFKVIKVHKDFENMEKDSEEYKISRNLISSIIDQVKIAEEDVRFVYDNWDLSKECLKKILKDY